jgi:RNA polymerase sigma factor (sigma-70 family)
MELTLTLRVTPYRERRTDRSVCVRNSRQALGVRQNIATLWSIGRVGEADDSDLLARFLLERDEGAELAFRTLVERHGGMVLNVCRQVLRDGDDAQDAAQAVFLILARKAGSIRKQGSVAPWLHGVARRVAVKARCRAAVRGRCEAAVQAVAARPETVSPPPEPSVDYEAVHAEVARLPERYRTPVVLCYLEGLTYEEAARRVGCPVGTIRVRLSRARDQLRARLERRGLGPAIAVPLFAGLLLADNACPAAALSAEWVDAMVRSALASNAGCAAGTASAPALDLSRKVIRSMMLAQLRTGLLCVVGLGLTTVACGVLLGRSEGKEPDPQPPANAADTTPGPKQELARQVLEAAISRFDTQHLFYERGWITIDRLIDASRQVRDAETRMAVTQDQRVAAAKAHVERLAALLKREMVEMEKDAGSNADLTEAEQALDQAALDLIDRQQAAGAPDLQAIERELSAARRRREEVKRLVEQNAPVPEPRP